MVTIVFEAHGTSLDNEAGLSSGWYDVALSPLGEEQARQLGERHQGENFDAIFVSDLQRSYRTAEIAFTGRNVPIIKNKRLRECDYGDLTKLSRQEVEPHRGEHISKPFPNGESYEQTTVRMKDFLQNLLRDYDDKRIMIIGHRATQYGLEHWINNVPLKQAVIAPWSWQPGWAYHLRKIK